MVAVEVEKNCLIKIKNQVFNILLDFPLLLLCEMALKKTLIYHWDSVWAMDDLKLSWADVMGNRASAALSF